jgi:hypothetical protein
MAILAKPLINAKYAANSATTEYTSPASTRTIIDKFTVTNITGVAVTLTVHLVPSGGSADNTNKIIDALSVAANATTDISSLQNQILAAADFISVLASAANSLVIRASGRQVT